MKRCSYFFCVCVSNSKCELIAGKVGNWRNVGLYAVVLFWGISQVPGLGAFYCVISNLHIVILSLCCSSVALKSQLCIHRKWTTLVALSLATVNTSRTRCSPSSEQRTMTVHVPFVENWKHRKNKELTHMKECEHKLSHDGKKILSVCSLEEK